MKCSSWKLISKTITKVHRKTSIAFKILFFFVTFFLIIFCLFLEQVVKEIIRFFDWTKRKEDTSHNRPQQDWVEISFIFASGVDFFQEIKKSFKMGVCLDICVVLSYFLNFSQTLRHFFTDWLFHLFFVGWTFLWFSVFSPTFFSFASRLKRFRFLFNYLAVSTSFKLNFMQIHQRNPIEISLSSECHTPKIKTVWMANYLNSKGAKRSHNEHRQWLLKSLHSATSNRKRWSEMSPDNL